MEQKDAINVFEDKQVRTVWDGDREKWFFSIIDVIAALTGSERPRKYWNDLKAKLSKEGSQLSDKIGQLKMKAEDGKKKVARLELEARTGKKVVTGLSAKKALKGKG